jgi:hypothetical protein
MSASPEGIPSSPPSLERTDQKQPPCGRLHPRPPSRSVAHESERGCLGTRGNRAPRAWLAGAEGAALQRPTAKEAGAMSAAHWQRAVGRVLGQSGRTLDTGPASSTFWKRRASGQVIGYSERHYHPQPRRAASPLTSACSSVESNVGWLPQARLRCHRDITRFDVDHLIPPLLERLRSIAHQPRLTEIREHAVHGGLLGHVGHCQSLGLVVLRTRGWQHFSATESLHLHAVILTAGSSPRASWRP